MILYAVTIFLSADVGALGPGGGGPGCATAEDTAMDLSVEGKSERIPSGSHIVQLYNKVSEITGVTARLLEMGLQAHEKCLFAGAPAVSSPRRAAK